MKFNQLSFPETNRHRRRRGRGIAAGLGKTAGRGTKGQKSRSGGSLRPGFEGGQNPLVRRLPKLPGFRSHRRPAQVVYTGSLNDIKADPVTAAVLVSNRLVEDQYHPIKLIVKGKLERSCRVELDRASQAAIAQIEAAGGQFVAVGRQQRPKQKKGDQKAG